MAPETAEYRRLCAVHTHPWDDHFIEIGCDFGLTSGEVVVGGRRRHGHGGGTPTKTMTKRKLGIDKSPTSIAMATQKYPHDDFLVVDVLAITEAELYQILLQYQFVRRTTTHRRRTTSHTTTTRSDRNTTRTTTPDNKPVDEEPKPHHHDPDTATTTTTTADDDDDDDDDDDPAMAKEEAAEEGPDGGKFVVAIDINGNRDLDAVRQCLDRVVRCWKPELVIVKSRAFYRKLIELGY